MDIPVKPTKLTSPNTDFGTSIAKALWADAAALLEYVNASYPIGMLMFYSMSLEQLPSPPDPTLWQFMDGSTISNVNSPLNGQTVPDMRGMFMRSPVTGEVVLTTGGSDTLNLFHDHGGETGNVSDAGPLVAEFDPDPTDIDRPFPSTHLHTIPLAALSRQIIPSSSELQVYMRIA